MKKEIIVIGILVILLFSSLAVGLGSGNASGNVVKKINEGGMRGYTSHGVIRINSNADFTSQNGVVGGSGIQSDPYIISGWDIDAHGAGNAIYIGNTTAYFVVENCYLHNAVDGIMLYNVTNGKISGNTITNNSGFGISLYSSSSNTVSGNNITNNSGGIVLYSSSSNTIGGNNITNNGQDSIYLYSSSSNTISRNNITNNGQDSIYLYSSSSNTISRNNITNNKYGIDLGDSSSNTISGNRMIGDSIVLYGSKDTFISQTIYTNNTVNGRPVYYYKNVNMNNATVPLDAGEVMCGNVSWLNIEGLDLSNGSVGIEIGYSSHIMISGNNITNSWEGIYLYSSSSNTISRNNIANNKYDAIYLVPSSNYNTISRNNITNNGEGIWLGSSSSNTISGNNITNNKDGGIYLGDSSSNTICNNLISNNTNCGIYISDGSYNLIYNNSFYYNHFSGDTYESSLVQACDYGINNYWNSSSGIGNYWHDWANNNDTNDQNNDGIVDWPYKIAGSAHGKDNYPLKNPTYPMPTLAPTIPRNLHAVMGNDFVNLTWQMPLGNGSTPITEYRIYRNGTFIASLPASQLYYNDTNVSNGVTYTYYVTAVNSVGESAKSNQVQATPSGTIPEFSAGIWIFIVVLIALLGAVRFRKFS